nr:hypothetical protein F40H7.9 - Caenorhabditis elegans [Caenorhabditis elegans]
MDVDEISTKTVGAHMLLTSFGGILMNLYMFYHFSKLQKTSFYILCASKTVSNTLMLLTYLLYVGPVNVLYTAIGYSELNSYVNQMNSFGFYLQGPITQLMITVNRFLVVWISAAKTTNSSTKVTVIALAISWIFAAWLSTLAGLPEMINLLFIAVFSLGVSTNVMNVFIAIKLFILSKSSQLLSSNTSQSRKKNRIYLFLQSCFQDWICVLDIVNNMISGFYCTDRTCIVLVTMGFGVTVYLADGVLMYLFNCKLNSDSKMSPNKLKNAKTSQNAKKSTVTPIS